MKKIILITGASSGIGKATARLLLQDGHTVYGASRSLEKMKDIQQMGVHTLEMDVSKDDSMQEGIAQIMEAEGYIDVLINNAGYGSYGALEDTPMEEARYQFEVNVFGLARLCQLVLPKMRAQRSGTIINISSIGGKIGEPHGSWYHATKFAVEGLSDCLRLELRQFNINVVVIEPGAIKTEWNTIARQNLREVSGDTAYRDLVEKHAKLLEKGDEQASDPIVVAKTIRKAVNAHKPKTRYATGKGAKIILFLRKILPDRWMDAMFLAVIKNVK